jgi:hypothetical protein
LSRADREDVVQRIAAECMAATLMFKRYGDKALGESAILADLLAAGGNQDGAANVELRLSARSEPCRSSAGGAGQKHSQSALCLSPL